jgi:hypothetical protein
LIDSKRALLLVAALTMVAGLLILFPARIAYQWAMPSQIAVSGIHGTVWRGKAESTFATSAGAYDRCTCSPAKCHTVSRDLRLPVLLKAMSDSAFLAP